MADQVKNYKVFITPLFDNETYHDPDGFVGNIDITDYVEIDGVSPISRQADLGDYLVGVYGFTEIKLKCRNEDGRFNPPTIFNNRVNYFRYERDRCKVVVKYFDKDGVEHISFQGIINEEGTKQDWMRGSVELSVLSNDSILRKVAIPSGAVGDGMLISEAIHSILNKPPILAVLNYDPLNVDVGVDIVVDLGSFFDLKPSRDGLDELLKASNSVIVIDAANNIYIRPRTENSNTPWAFYGESDLHGRTNIVSIENFNTGLQRAFNQVKVNDFTATHLKYTTRYGLRNTELKFDWLTTPAKWETIAKSYANTFAQPRMECELVTVTEIGKEIEMFDRVTIDYGNRVSKSSKSDHIPIQGIDKYGQAVYPYNQGVFKITPKIVWKVTGIEHDTKNLLTKLRLREIGISDIEGFPPEF